jgi:hypothetical protein
MANKMKFLTFEQFRETDAISVSRLNDLSYSPLLYKQNLEAVEKEPTAAMRFGSAVDCMITQDSSEFQERYYVSSISEPPSETIQKIVTGVYNEIDTADSLHAFSELSDFSNEILEHAAYQQYGQSWKPETLVKKVVDAGSSYFNELFDSNGKEILKQEEFESIVAVVESLNNNEFTKIFISGDEYERWWQLPIVFDYKVDDETITCKALLDLLIIDHKNKEIRVFDIKTTGQSVYSFSSSYMKFGYFRQGSFYFRAATNFLRNVFPDYTVMNPEFIVAEQANINPPMIYKMSTQDIMTGEHGGVTTFGKEVKGYRQLIKDLIWHRETDKWDYHREVYQNNGVTVIDNFRNDGANVNLPVPAQEMVDDLFETLANITKPDSNNSAN